MPIDSAALQGVIETIKTDIGALDTNITNSLETANLVISNNPSMIEEVRKRNQELQSKKDKLLAEIAEQNAIIERGNRDFMDVKNTQPEMMKKTKLRVIEDYTLAVLMMAYLLMALAALYIYVISSPELTTALVKGILYLILASAMGWMALYYLC
jgi:uncharacterized membrane protein (DUF106 family)